MQPTKTRGAVVIDLKVGQSLTLDVSEGDPMIFRPGIDTGEIRITLKSKHGQRARVVVQADESVKVRRPDKVPA